MELVFIEEHADAVSIPADLLRAVQSPESFREVHSTYVRRFGQITREKAFNLLNSDLKAHGLPVRYDNMSSFKAIISRKMSKKR